jgi:hypothetical protein
MEITEKNDGKKFFFWGLVTIEEIERIKRISWFSKNFMFKGIF